MESSTSMVKALYQVTSRLEVIEKKHSDCIIFDTHADAFSNWIEFDCYDTEMAKDIMNSFGRSKYEQVEEDGEEYTSFKLYY